MVKIDIQFFGGGSSGGKGKGMKKAATPQTQTATAAAAVAAPANATTANQTFQQRQQAFYDMDAQEFENYLDKTLGNDIQMPADYHSGIALQKMIYDLGMNDKPTVMDNKSFDNYLKANPNAKVLYRGVNGNAAISADAILDQLRYSDGTHVGGGYYGDGLYFSGDPSTARSYSRGSWGYDGAILRVALAPDAKVITRKALNKLYSQLPSSTQSKLSAAGKKSTWGNDGESQLALKLGYDAIEGGFRDHLIVLNRKALICDSKNYAGGSKARFSKRYSNMDYNSVSTAVTSKKHDSDYVQAKKNNVFGTARYRDNWFDI